MSTRPLRASDLLAYTLHEARLLVGESPEQVGGSVGVAGRTIRRLEAAAVMRPRDITLNALGRYYGLDAAFLRWLAARPESGIELSETLGRRAELSEIAPVEDPRALTLMLARARAGGRATRNGEFDELRTDFELLNERRRRLVRELAQQLRLAQSEERRRREQAA